MRIGVMSDTHGGLKSWKRIINGVFSEVDLILHAGDIFYHGIRNPQPDGYDTLNLAQEINDLKKPLVVCKGNCDSEVDQVALDIPIQSPYSLCLFDGLKILLHHGHLLNDEEILKLSSRWNFGVVISGHTHVTRLEQINQIVFLNPGSHSLPKGDGIPTVALLETRGGKALIDIIDYQQEKSLKNLVLE